jgi:putative serine protease PepD
VLPGLKLGKTVSHAWLGVRIGTPSSVNPSTPSGAEIGSVTTGGPADDAGLQAGDIVTDIQGERIDDATDLSSYINTKAPGDKITMSVRRNGQTEKIDVLLGNQPPKVP